MLKPVITQTDKRQATLNQIYNSVEYAMTGGRGTKTTFFIANRSDSSSVLIENTADGCNGAGTLDITLFGSVVPAGGGKEQHFFNSASKATEWLNNRLAPAVDLIDHAKPAPATNHSAQSYTRC